MKEIISLFTLKSLKVRDRISVYYFAVSFLLAGCLSEGTSIIAIIAIIVNLANAVRLVNKIELPDDFLKD